MLDELIAGFDGSIFCKFLNTKFAGSFSASHHVIPFKMEFGWEKAERLGVVKTLTGPNGANMPLLVVTAKLSAGATLKERSSRLKQFKFAKQVLDQAMSTPSPGVEGVVTQGLFVFHDDNGNFRLSLVYGKAEGTKLVWSTAKRQSFHVQAGEGNKTFHDRMAMPWVSFDKLKEAFSVEKLTKEFYNRLFDWYQWALSPEMNVTYPNDTSKADDDRQINEHIIRLITRLMFVWFLKQKHLLPDNLFDQASLKKLLKSFSPTTGDNYYRAILQNLFFATLNSEISERAFAVDAGNISDNKEHFGIKTLYRYGGEFSGSEKEVLKLFSAIPFLNGGLFECLDKDKDYYDGFSRNPKKQARIPNRLFFDEARGLIPLLQQYNFTVEENSPGDEEVALDPELLGKVFEKLLGAYNTETNVAARNATGSFYTPREIVNYMVDESLITHLTGKCGEEHVDVIRKLFTDSERPADKSLCKKMDDALVTAKILDPACGSGAFPMGVLLRMVELLRILRNLPEEQSVYDLKLELIENCIYGGDIQCIAVQISKLRFFISLVCEQKPTNDAKDNYGIHTLPNLETKFVAADSLVGLPKEGKDALDLYTGNITQLKQDLWEIRHRHFRAKSYKEKKELRKLDKQKRDEIKKAVQQASKPDKKRLEHLIEERKKFAQPKMLQKAKQVDLFAGFETSRTRPEELEYDVNEETRNELDAQITREKKKADIPITVIDQIADLLASWDPYDQNTRAAFSDPEWMFNVKDGFDVVIGNPPYVQIQKLPEETKDVLAAQNYKTFSKSADMYCLFYERGGRLLSPTGNLCYISSNKFFRAGYGKPLRQLLTQSYSLYLLIDFGELPVFEAGTDPVIVQFGNPARASFLSATIKNMAHISTLREVLAEIGRQMTGAELPEACWALSGLTTTGILNKMRSAGKPLGEYVNGEVYYGIKTGYDKAFILDDTKYNSIIKKNNKCSEVIFPFFKGDDVRKWVCSKRNQWHIVTKIGVDMAMYPEVMQHLQLFSSELKKRSDKGNHWWELRSCAYYDKMEAPKIVFPDIAKSSRFALDETGSYLMTTSFFIPTTDRYLLALLNSYAMWFWASCSLAVLGDSNKGGRLRFKRQYVLHFPIPKTTPKQRTTIECFVDRILSAKKADPSADTTKLEDEIDELVYDLYGLTPEEKEIVKQSVSHGGTAAEVSELDEEGDADIPVCDTKQSEKLGQPSKKKRKPQLPPSLPGWD